MENSTFSHRPSKANTNFDEMNRNEIDLLNKSIREGFIYTHFMGQFAYFYAEDIT